MRFPEQLPDLGGKALLVFRIIWVIIFLGGILSVADVVRSDFYFRQLNENTAALGIARDGPFAFERVRAFEPENGLDVRSGDALRAVDGKPIGAIKEALESLQGADGATVELTLQGEDDQQFRTIQVTRDMGKIHEFYVGSGLSYAEARNIRLAIGVVLMSAWSLVALLLFLRRPSDPIAALISMGAVISRVDLDLFLPMISSTLASSISFVGFGFVLIGLVLFPGGKIQPRWSWLGVILIFLSFATIETVAFMGAQVFPLQPILVGGCMIFILTAMVVRYRRYADDVVRQQIKFVLFGISLSITLFVPAMIWIQLVEVDALASSPWAEVVHSFILGSARLALPGGILIALLQYRLFDADRVISRSATYALMTLVIGIAFFVMERIIDFVGNQLIGGGIGAASFGISAALAAVLLNPLHSRLVSWSERRFQRTLVNLRDELPEAARDMRQISSMRDLLQDFIARVKPAVYARRAAIVSPEMLLVEASDSADHQDIATWTKSFDPKPDKNGLDIDRTDPQFPFRMQIQSTAGYSAGWLLLGPRIDDSFYNRDERSTIAGLADPMARAIATVSRREQREENVNQEIKDIKQLLDSQGASLEKLANRIIRMSSKDD